MFTQPCFIRKNTSELREKLHSIGYDVSDSLNLMGDYIKCYNGSVECILRPFDFKEKEELDRYIDCGENEDLFLAIAALRDDSNEHQWFIWDKEEGEKDNSNKWKLYDNNPDWSWWIFEVHKATVEELIEHFKSK